MLTATLKTKAVQKRGFGEVSDRGSGRFVGKPRQSHTEENRVANPKIDSIRTTLMVPRPTESAADSRTAVRRFQEEIVRQDVIRRRWRVQNPLQNMFLSSQKPASLQDAPQ